MSKIVTVASVAYEMIASNSDKSNEEIANLVKEHFATIHDKTVATSASCIAWYKSKKKDAIKQQIAKNQEKQQEVTVESVSNKIDELQMQLEEQQELLQKLQEEAKLKQEQQMQELANNLNEEQLMKLLQKLQEKQQEQQEQE